MHLHHEETHGWDEAHAERKIESCDKSEFMRNEYAVLVKIVLCLEKKHDKYVYDVNFIINLWRSSELTAMHLTPRGLSGLSPGKLDHPAMKGQCLCLRPLPSLLHWGTMSFEGLSTLRQQSTLNFSSLCPAFQLSGRLHLIFCSIPFCFSSMSSPIPPRRIQN